MSLIKKRKGALLETSTKCKHTKCTTSNRVRHLPVFMIQIISVIPWHGKKINGNKPREDIYIEKLIQEEIKAAFTGSKV